MLINPIRSLSSRLHCAVMRIKVTLIEQDTYFLESALLAAPSMIERNRARLEALRVAISIKEARNAVRR